MGLDVRRHIEVLTEDIVGTFDKKDLPKLGQLDKGDVILIYRPDREGENYWKVNNIWVDHANRVRLEYEVLETPKDMESALKFNPDIAMRVEYTKQVPRYNIEFKNDDIIKYWDGGTAKYLKYNNGDWEEIEAAPKSWKPITYKDNEGDIITAIDNLRGYFVDKYIYGDFYGDTDNTYVGRGLPDDISEIVKSHIDDEEFKRSYITLSELDNVISLAKEKYLNALKAKLQKDSTDDINDKLDFIISQMRERFGERKEYKAKEKSEEDEYIDADENEIIDDLFYTMMSASNEYYMAETMAKNFKGVYSDDDIRIIYAFNN